MWKTNQHMEFTNANVLLMEMFGRAKRNSNGNKFVDDTYGDPSLNFRRRRSES